MVGRIKIFLGELCPFSAFVMLKAAFSEHQLIKISIAHMYIKTEVDTKMIQQQWVQPQMKLVYGNSMKITI